MQGHLNMRVEQRRDGLRQALNIRIRQWHFAILSISGLPVNSGRRRLTKSAWITSMPRISPLVTITNLRFGARLAYELEGCIPVKWSILGLPSPVDGGTQVRRKSDTATAAAERTL